MMQWSRRPQVCSSVGNQYATHDKDSSSNVRRVLWVAPNLNFYKQRYLNRLVENSDFEITVFAGSALPSQGHVYFDDDQRFRVISVDAKKWRFGFSPMACFRLFEQIWNGRHDIVIMPIEKKHLPMIIGVLALRRLFRFQLINHSHRCLRSLNGRETWFDRISARVLNAGYDRVVFYTQQARDWAIARSLVSPGKAHFANNTIDTAEIWKHYDFAINRTCPKRLLFLGRLIRSKRLDLLLQYYRQLKEHLPELRLEIIGDGPESDIVRDAASNDPFITWHGAIIEEMEIARIMEGAHVVFLPGHSGLSIVHAFCYGKPYVTFDTNCVRHPPEISYLKDGSNGLLLTGDLAYDTRRFVELLSDDENYAKFSRAAFATAKELSVENWCDQMTAAFKVP